MVVRSFHDGLCKLEILGAYWGLAVFMALKSGSGRSALTIFAVCAGVWFLSQHPRAEAVAAGAAAALSLIGAEIPVRVLIGLGTAGILLLLQLKKPLFWGFAVLVSLFESLLLGAGLVRLAGLTDGRFWYAAVGVSVFILCMTYHEAVCAYLFPEGGGIAKRRVLLPAAGKHERNKDDFWDE